MVRSLRESHDTPRESQWRTTKGVDMTAAERAERAIYESIIRDRIVTIPDSAPAREYLAREADDWVANGPVIEYWGQDEEGNTWRVHIAATASIGVSIAK